MSYLALPPSTHLGSMVTTARDHRIAAVLHEAELSPPQRIPTLAEPHIRDFESSLPSNIDEARSLLVQQRISEPGYRQPDQQKRHIFRSKKSKEAKCNTDNWIFTKHEVAKAFDDLLSRAPLPMPGIAQALLSHASVASLEELWYHFYHPKLEERTESRSNKPRSSALPKTISSVALKTRSSVALETTSAVVLKTGSSVALETTSAVVPEITWLDEVCGQENLEYIRLMCQAGLEQDALDRAFRIALSKHSMDAMEVLLSFGAVASAACQDAIRERVKLHDVALVRLLLSAPNAMSVEAWRGCMEPEVQSLEARWIPSPDLLLLCLAHSPDVACKHLLLKALESQNLPATAIMLAYGRFFGRYFRNVRQLACEIASRVQNDGRRHKFFTMLVESEFVTDGPVLRQELMKDVKTRQLPLIKLLADAGVILDIEPHNAFYWAVSHMDLDILELFKSGKFSSPISLALKFVPDSISESDMLRLVGIFGPIGLAGKPLDSYLIRAVRRRHIQLVDALIRYGASIEFEQASAIQTALENADLDILSILLRSKCSAKILSATIPTAMVLKPRPIRLQAMKALVKKGVLPQKLGVPLQRLVSEDGDVDSELIQLLLQHEAPVDGVGDDANNVLLVAARRGNLSILRMLCDAGPRNETLSKAVHVAFGVMDTCGHDVALDMIKLLLARGAEVKFETLKVALETSSLKLLDVLVSSIKSADTVVRTFKYARKTTMVLDRRYWIYQHLLGKGIPSDDVSEAFLDLLKADDLGDLSFLKLLLENGASPGYQNGEPFSLALRANSLVAVRLLTQYLVDDSMATVAFDVVRKTPSLKKHVRVEIYRPLLEWNISKSSISQALVDSFKGGHPDISFLRLLLAKGADPNKGNGHCFAVASKAGALAEFRALSKYAKLPEVLKVLLNNFQEEWEVIRWFKVCLEEQPRLGKIDQDELVFQCIRKFPGETTLLKLLLDQGVSASTKMDHCLCVGWKPEPCTALIWALFSKPRIENNVILVLLSRGDAGMLHVYYIVFPYD
jgi:ankyrin repeat protein